MSPEAILLSIHDRSGEGSYRFSCPHCLDTVEKPADRKVAALLLSAGVELAEEMAEERQGELFHAGAGMADRPHEGRPNGPPFTVDDLISFHFLLQDDDRFYRALHEH
jgi:hypothetical protein